MTPTQPPTQPPTLLITGATDGIGLALAQQLAASGARLVLVGRRPLDDLPASLFSAATYCRVDLAAPDAATQVAAWLSDHAITALDAVYLNAASGYIGNTAAQPQADIHRQVAVNLWTPIALTHALAPHVEAARGAFIFISSVATAIPTPDYAVYTATKAALEAFARALRSELIADRRPIRVHIIRPGATRTNFHTKSGVAADHYDTTRFADPNTVAAAILAAVAAGKQEVTLGTANRLAATIARVAPSLFLSAVRRRQPDPAPAPDSPTPPHVVITGAANGIGLELARRFAAAGYTVTGIDRDAAANRRAQADFAATGGDHHYLTADLAAPAIAEELSTALAARPPITILIHNAGINAVGPFLASALADQSAVLAVNLTAPLTLTAALLANARLAQGGSVVAISSLSHYIGYPGAAVYAATKDGLASYATSMAGATTTAQRHWLTVFPGPTRTDHAARYSPDNSRAHRRMDPARLADLVFQAVQTRRSRLIPGRANRLLARAARLLPGPTAAAMRHILYTPLKRAQPGG